MDEVRSFSVAIVLMASLVGWLGKTCAAKYQKFRVVEDEVAEAEIEAVTTRLDKF